MGNDKSSDNRSKRKSPALTDEPSELGHQELHLRVTAMEGIATQQQRELDSAHAGLADLQDRMAVLEAEVGLS